MTLNTSLEYALLAMDVYNRGEAGGMGYGENDPDSTDIPLGATILAKSRDLYTQGEDAAQSFYAVAYEYNGEVIISYRGTDDRNLLNFNGDAWTGWGVGLGNPGSPQGIMAIQFYQYVVNQKHADPADIVLTGHSLGGGLAGLVASIYGLQAVVFRPGFGDDGVSDFQIHNGGSNGDVIEVHDHAGLTFAAIIADAEQWGPNAHLDLGSGEFITLYGVSVTALTTQDFRFV